MDPLPNVNRAHSMAAHDEAQRFITQGRDSSSEVMGFAAKIANEFSGGNPNFGSNRGDFKPRGRPFCDYCGRNGHHRATYYQLMDIQPLINRINAVRKPIRRGSLGLEENLGLPLPLFHNSVQAMRDSVSDMGNRDNLEASTRAAHLRHVWPSLLVGNGGPIS
ncbi:hypothetical protein CRG98_039405 [Punica granatum]|uniref:CCHC-type domain-containing protein n=1 Tax=Punica granatum TaxID=22663 RepID=A0A2I0I8B1_PUNGR|nr:hypothetical protein CRG98_039405 [Punica granatum]